MTLAAHLRGVTRKRPIHRIVRGFEILGVRYARMLHYRVDRSKFNRNSEASDVTIETFSNQERERVPTDISVEDMVADDRIVVAFENGEWVGYLWLSGRECYHIGPIDRNVDISGAFIWRVFVVRSHRQRGIAKAMLTAAVDNEFDEERAETVSAFVAANNFPSKNLFQSVGFEATASYRYINIFGFERLTYQEL